MRLEPKGAVSLLLLLLPASGNMLLWSLPLPLAQMEALAMFSDGLNNSRACSAPALTNNGQSLRVAEKNSKEEDFICVPQEQSCGSSKMATSSAKKVK